MLLRKLLVVRLQLNSKLTLPYKLLGISKIVGTADLEDLQTTTSNPPGIYLLKVNNRNSGKNKEICWRRSDVFVVNFDHVIAGWERHKNINIKIFSNIHTIFLCTYLKIYINPNTKIILKIS